MGALDPWACSTRRMIWARAVSAPTFVAVKVKDPGFVDRCGVNGGALLFGDGHALPGEHGFIDARRSGDDHAVRGDSLSGADEEEIALDDPLNGDILLGAVADDPGGLGPEPHEALDGRRGLALCLRLEEPAQDDQGNDQGGAVVIDVGRNARAGEHLGDESGQGGIGVGREGPDGNEGIHVRCPLPGGLDRPDEEAAAHPEDDGGRQQEQGDQQRLPGDSHEEGKPVLHGAEKDHHAKAPCRRQSGFQIPDFLFPGRGNRIFPEFIGNAKILVSRFRDEGRPPPGPPSPRDAGLSPGPLPD